MKRLLLLFLLLFPCFLKAQISTNIPPKSRVVDLSQYFGGRVDSKIFDLPIVDNTLEQQQADLKAAQDCPGCKQNYFGKNFPVDISVKNLAQRIEIEGGTVYILRIHSANAQNLMLRFRQFLIPKNATLHLYSPTSDFIMGAFTSKNTNPDGRFFTGVFPEDELVLEYYEPDTPEFSGEITIDGVVHGFRAIFKQDGFGTSGSCTVNVNCDDTLTKESKAIGYLIAMNDELAVQGTGFLVNSTSADYKRPYFLTAHHVLIADAEHINVEYFSDILVYFKYENKECTNDLWSPLQGLLPMQGASYRSIGRPGATNQECEYILLELNDNPAMYTQVAYLGWDMRSGVPSGKPYYTISHPVGDAKKKAKLDGAPTEVIETIGNSVMPLFSVTWSEGITLQGSSGSPLLNSAKRVVGILSGGESRCADSPGEGGASKGPDFFSKFYLAFSKPLQDWPSLRSFLDNGSTRVNYLDTELSVPITPGEPSPGPQCATTPDTDPTALKVTIARGMERQFGKAVSVEGDYMVVGAPGEMKAYVYRKQGCDFVREAQLNSDALFGRFGYSVDIYGNYIIVGDPGDEATTAGYVYVFKKVNGVWQKVQRITTGKNGFGTAIAIWDNHVIIGSPSEAGTFGRVYIYRKGTNEVWNEAGSTTGFTNSKLGTSVDINKNHAVAGLSYNSMLFIFDLSLSRPGDLPAEQLYEKYGGGWGVSVSFTDDGQELITTGGLRYCYILKLVGGKFAFAMSIESVNSEIRNVSNAAGGYFVVASYTSGDATLDIYRRESLGVWKKVNAIDRSGSSANPLAVSSSNFIVEGKSEAWQKPECPDPHPGSVFINDLNIAVNGDAGNVAICNKVISTSQPPVYSKYVVLADDCPVTFAPGSNAEYVVYGDAYLGRGFVAQAGSTLVIRGMAACADWPGSTIAARAPASPETSFTQPEPMQELNEVNEFISVYPNPSTGTFRIVAQDAKIISIQLYDAQGLESKGHDIHAVDAQAYEVQCNPSVKGICMIRISTDKGISVAKIFVR